MSRDWRPVDLYFADKKLCLRKYNFTMVDTNSGEEIELFKKPPEMVTAYPELSFLFSDIANLYEKHGKTDAGKMLFTQLEQGIKEAEALADANELPHSFQSAELSFCEMFNLDDGRFCLLPPSAVVKEWFIGKLDDNFYYNERNNSILSLYIEKHLAKQ